MKLDPHWAFAHQPAGRIWGAPVPSGAVVVQMGRRSSDGAFEVGVEIAARTGPLTFDARSLILDLPGARVAAEVPDGEARRGPGRARGDRIAALCLPPAREDMAERHRRRAGAHHHRRGPPGHAAGRPDFRRKDVAPWPGEPRLR